MSIDDRGDVGSIDRDWAEMLAAWAIPERLLAAVPASPYFFDPAVFIAAADEALARSDDSVSDRIAREAMPATTGSVLDVGAGAGAASVRLGGVEVIGVDPSAELLEAFADRVARTGRKATLVAGTWPAAAAGSPMADVVVCHHVVYNVPQLAAFAIELAAHARRRVVVELTTEHPTGWMRPYWKALHGLDQPVRPTADDAIDVLRRLGFAVKQERWRRRYQMLGESGDQGVARLARRLCLPDDRHDELRDLMRTMPPPVARDVVTVWW
jgi:SAM-dependent methyltransferase